HVSGNDLGGRWRCSGGTNAGTVCDRDAVPTGCLGGGRCDLHDTSGARIENWSWDAGTLIGNTPVAPGDDHVALAWLVNHGPSATPGKLEATADPNAPAAAIALSASAGPGRVRCLVRR